MTVNTRKHNIEAVLLRTRLPGPDRKRTPRPYRYRLTYRNPDPDAVGCLLTWEVRGGRSPYQVAIERDDEGFVRSHCTCADAVYRGADRPGHVCKHVQGIVNIGREVFAFHPAGATAERVCA